MGELEDAQRRLEARRKTLEPRPGQKRIQAAVERIHRRTERAEVRQQERRTLLERCAREASKSQAVDRYLRDAGVPRRYRGGRVRPERVPEAVRLWCQGLRPALREGAGLLLAGNVGSGKTAAAAYVLTAAYRAGYVKEEPVVEWVAPSAWFLNAADLYDLVFRRDEAALRRARDVHVLVLDDWGVGYESEWPLAVMDRLVDHRWAEMRVTVVTTNLAPESPDPDVDTFARRYPRAYDRLLDASGPGLVEVVGPSGRRRAES